MVTIRSVALVLALLAGPVWGQAPGGWQMTCAGEGATRQCEAAQSVTLPVAAQPLAQAALGWLRPDGPLMLTVVVPPDVALATGLTLTPAQGPALTLPWGRCRPGGCFAVAEVTAPQLASLAAVDAAGLSYTDGGDASVTLRLSMTGFAAALTTLEQARGD